MSANSFSVSGNGSTSVFRPEDKQLGDRLSAQRLMIIAHSTLTIPYPSRGAEAGKFLAGMRVMRMHGANKA